MRLPATPRFGYSIITERSLYTTPKLYPVFGKPSRWRVTLRRLQIRTHAQPDPTTVRDKAVPMSWLFLQAYLRFAPLKVGSVFLATPPPFRTDSIFKRYWGTGLTIAPTIPFHMSARHGNFILGSAHCHKMSTQWPTLSVCVKSRLCGAGQSWTADTWIFSPVLYHWATAPFVIFVSV